MVVEHTFITTLESHDVIRMAWELLISRGFGPLPPQEMALRPQGPNVVELRRGRERPDGAKSVLELPQFVRVEWDRGRVVVAASITPRTWMGRQYTPGSITSQSAHARQPDQEGLMLAVVGALEMLLAYRRPPAECVAGLDHLQHRLHDDARRARRRAWLVAGAITFGFILLCVIAVVTFK
jgi:hypothetical protein